METRKRNVSLESILVMILLIIFAVSACVMIVQGSKSYNNIISQKEKEENARIALSYINMRVKQNDVSGSIRFEEKSVEGNDALIIAHSGEEDGYLTYIYWLDGVLWECYTSLDEIPTKALSSEIVPLEGLSFSYDQDHHAVAIHIDYKYGKEQLSLESIVTLRTNQL